MNPLQIFGPDILYSTVFLCSIESDMFWVNLCVTECYLNNAKYHLISIWTADIAPAWLSVALCIPNLPHPETKWDGKIRTSYSPGSSVLKASS